MIGRIRQILIKEFLQMLRDPRMRAIVFIMPCIQMLVFAFALTTDVTRIATAVLDDDNSPASRAVTQALVSTNHFVVTHRPETPAAARRLLDHGDVRAVFHFPDGFGNAVARGGPAKLQLLADGAESNSAPIVFGYANQIVSNYNLEIEGEKASPVGTAEIDSRAWYNENLESKLYFVPGLIAVMLMVVSLLLTSIAIVREKEIGTIEQIMVTPITSVELILGKTIPFLITGYITMTLMLALAFLVFGVRVEGSFVLLYLMAGVYISGNLGLAMTISVASETQQQALLTAFFIMMPGVLLSGFLFPIDNMPTVVRAITYLNPMRWFLEIVRGVTLKGTGLRTLWPDVLMQIVLATGFLTLAAKRFKKTLA
jgi:ABC-2 type transport system permease protein